MLQLSAALSDNVRTRPILDGQVEFGGIELNASALHPSEIFWRQLRYGDFDVSEMSISSLLIAASRGNRDWLALPVFTMRRFFHTGVLVRADSGIEEAAQLAGRKVAVPEYQQTAAIWSRGVLQHEFGVSPTQIDWYMERGADKSHGHATGFAPPAGVSVTQIAPQSSIGHMLVNGEIDATLLYLNEPNLVDRSTIDLTGRPEIRPLFPDAMAESRRYYAKVGYIPINHTLVVRRELVERHPWIALNLYNGFAAAKALAEQRARDVVQPYLIADLMQHGLTGPDPIAYGWRANLPVLETIARYVHEQGLTDAMVNVSTCFAPSVRDL